MSQRLRHIRTALGIALLVAAVCSVPRAQDKPAPGEKPLSEEIQRLPAVPVDKALDTIEVANGFKLELVAGEPDVNDPVDACFDENGRMYVAEMRCYPYFGEPTKQDPKGLGRKNAGVVRLLEDTDGDGRMDESSVFAKGISWPTSVCCYDGGVFVIAVPHLYYFKDLDGDKVADIREIIYSGFDVNNVQGVANNLKWGFDNRIYAAKGTNPADLLHRGEPLFALGSSDFSFDPRTEEVELTTSGSQFGHSMDDWGNTFVSSNSNHIQHKVFPYRYLQRNPYLAASNVVRTVAKEGAAAPVYRRSPAEPWRIVRTRRRLADPKYKDLPATEKVAIGFFTSATGVTIYRGDAYPEEYRGNAFIGDVGGNLVHRKKVMPNGASFIAERTEEGKEFISSTDTWFRPVNFVNAPDGTLYVLDMYRETIEHPFSIPEDIKQHLDLESGFDRGRVWRLVGPDGKRNPVVKMGGLPVTQLVAQLESGSSWNRETAQRLIWERQDPAAVEPLRKLVRETKSPLARAHALWALDGLKALTPDLVIATLNDSDAHVRDQALRLSEQFAKESPDVVEAVLARGDDEDYRVRFQLAFTLGELPADSRVQGLVRLARSIGSDSDMRTALLTSVVDGAASFATALLNDSDFLSQSHASGLIGELVRLVGTEKDTAGALQLLATVAKLNASAATRQQIVRSLGEGLGRSGLSIPRLVELPEANDELRTNVAALFAEAVSTAQDGEKSIGDRTTAARVLAYADYATASEALAALLAPATPRELQIAAIRALGEHTDPAVGELLLEFWRSASPEVRREVVDAVVARVDRIELLLNEIESGQIRLAEIERDKQEVLRNHPDEKLRERAKALIGAGVSSDRAQVIAAYTNALNLTGDKDRGRELFVKHCSVCHKLGDVGHQVGPEIASVSNKSPDDLLIAILDPSREAQPIYTSYTVVNDQGKLFTGIIVAENETSLTLRRSEGKEDVVLRNTIETLASSGQSLMPVGLEKEISPEQMADVIAFVKTIKPQQ